MGRQITMATRDEILRLLRTRYRGATRAEKSRIIDERIALAGYHRKHAIRLLAEQIPSASPPRRSRREYDERFCETLIVLWEAADRVCSKL